MLVYYTLHLHVLLLFVYIRTVIIIYIMSIIKYIIYIQTENKFYYSIVLKNIIEVFI